MSELMPVRVIVEQRIYENYKLKKLIDQVFGKHQKIAWKFIAWLKRNPRLDKKLRGKLIDTLVEEQKTWV